MGMYFMIRGLVDEIYSLQESQMWDSFEGKAKGKGACIANSLREMLLEMQWR